MSNAAMAVGEGALAAASRSVIMFTSGGWESGGHGVGSYFEWRTTDFTGLGLLRVLGDRAYPTRSRQICVRRLNRGVGGLGGEYCCGEGMEGNKRAVMCGAWTRPFSIKGSIQWWIEFLRAIQLLVFPLGASRQWGRFLIWTPTTICASLPLLWPLPTRHSSRSHGFCSELEHWHGHKCCVYPVLVYLLHKPRGQGCEWQQRKGVQEVPRGLRGHKQSAF